MAQDPITDTLDADHQPPSISLMQIHTLLHYVIPESSSKFNAMEDALPEPVNEHPLPPFKVLVDLFERLHATKGVGAKEERKSMISEFITWWRATVGPNIYPAFQLMMPHLPADNKRVLYNARESTFGKVLVKAMNLNPSSDDAKKLMNFKSLANNRTAGNFAEVVYEQVESRRRNLSFSNKTVGEVLEQLENLSASNIDQKAAIFTELINTLNAVEIKWVMCIVLHSMHLNVSHETILSIWHRDANAFFNVTNDLKMVCYQLWDYKTRILATVKPMQCFMPQRAMFNSKLAKNFQEIVDIMPETFYLEEKMDGERMQLHYTQFGKQTKFFSRNAKDYTSSYGTSVDDQKGSLAKFLPHILDTRVEECILDGEVVAWDTKNHEILPITNIKSVAINEGRHQFVPLFLVFDVLYLKAKHTKDLTDSALKDRKKVLRSILKDDPDARIRPLPYVEASSAAEIKTEFERVISALSEGIVVKNPKSIYVPNSRNETWIKVKPEFFTGYGRDNLDLIVVGANHGQGKRTGLSSFLCAIYDEENQEFKTLCKVGNGFSTAAFQKIWHITQDKWKDSPTENVKMGKLAMDKYIDPEQSLVFEVKATEIVPSDNFTAGYSLRFPRFVRLREDKSWKDAMTYDDLIKLRNDTAPLTPSRRKRNTENIVSSQRKKLRLQLPLVDVHARESDIFHDKSFFVAGDIREPRYMRQTEFETVIERNGGKIVRDSDQADFVVADRMLPKVAPLVRRESIVHPRYIFDCLFNGRLLKNEPDDYLYAQTETLEAALSNADSLGFSDRLYRREDIPRKLQTVPPCQGLETQRRTALKVLMQVSGDFSGFRGFLFYGLLFYLDESVDTSQDLVRLIKFGHGTTTILPDDPDITHVICNDRSRKKLYAKEYGPHIVDTSWVYRCWREESLLDERIYSDGTPPEP